MTNAVLFRFKRILEAVNALFKENRIERLVQNEVGSAFFLNFEENVLF